MAKKTKRKASAFALRVGAGRRRGLTFKQAVQAAKRGGKSKPLNRRKSINTGMARRRRRSAPRRALRRVRRRVSRSRGFNIMQEIVPIAGVAVIEPQLNGVLRSVTGRFAPGLPIADAAEIFLGSFLAKKGGVTGKAGRAMATIATARLVTGFLGGNALGNILGGGGAQQPPTGASF